MMRRSLASLTLLGALIAGACAAEPQSEGTEELTRSLLSQPAGDGASSPVAGGGAPVPGGPQVQVALVGINRGSEDALVKVVEMSDYGCGYCRQFHQESFPTLKREFIETGMVEWKFVPYITGMFDNSLAATEAADCTYVQSASAFEQLNGRLWEEQPQWKNSGEPESVVRGWVSELGIDMGVFDSCLAEDRQVQRIASATTLARQIGVRGTPTFVVIGWPPVQGALPVEMFQSLLTAAHAQLVADTARASGAGQN